MNPFKDILGGALKDVIGAVGGIIAQFHLSPEEQAAAQQKLTDATLSFETTMAQMDTEWAKAQAGVVTAEANSQSWIARNWRPMVMLMFAYIIFHSYVLVPVFRIPAVVIPPDLWDLLKIGMGGYIIGRSVEKTAPAVTQILTAAKK